MTTDTSEKGLESLIVDAMTDRGWIAGAPIDYDREYAIDLKQLTIHAGTKTDSIECSDRSQTGEINRHVSLFRSCDANWKSLLTS